MVVIVVDPDLGPVEGNLKAIDTRKEPCPHLRGSKPGKFFCAIHDKPWYKETPCFQHTQIERSPNDKCRMGKYVLGVGKA
ncbi:MAG: hypothetical protein DRP45_12045 [Candidatus Zixiibacteriota bacterium]|nr:MAG: hypothetical protein DRP45_12045 [candidate division Zixibacteria bacterium]